jgi:hypothetical protein
MSADWHDHGSRRTPIASVRRAIRNNVQLAYSSSVEIISSPKERRMQLAKILMLSCWLAALALPGVVHSDDRQHAREIPAREMAPTAVRADDETLPGTVPRDYVITPSGYMHPSCVHHIESDETVLQDGTVRKADGSSRKVQPCGYARFDRDGARVDSPRAASYVGKANSCGVISNATWELAASYVVSPAAAMIDGYGAVVPPPPSVVSGQSVYFFNGFEQYCNDVSILQPVLAWNGFNDNKYTIAAHNCCSNGDFYSTPVTVQPGDLLEFLIYGSNCSGSVCNSWLIRLNDFTPTLHQTTLLYSTSIYNQTFNWVFGAVLEQYGVTQCAQYPASGQFRIPQTSITDVTGASVTNVTWTKGRWNQTLPCGYGFTLGAPNSGSAGDITLRY